MIMGLSFPSAIFSLTVLLVAILYLGSNDARGRGRILSGSAAVYLLAFLAWTAAALLFRFAPDRVAAVFPNLASLGEAYRMIAAVGWFVLTAALTRAFSPSVPFALRAATALAIAFVVVLIGGNFIFIWITGAG